MSADKEFIVLDEPESPGPKIFRANSIVAVEVAKEHKTARVLLTGSHCVTLTSGEAEELLKKILPKKKDFKGFT
jgi:hypothetical protein